MQKYFADGTIKHKVSDMLVGRSRGRHYGSTVLTDCCVSNTVTYFIKRRHHTGLASKCRYFCQRLVLL